MATAPEEHAVSQPLLPASKSEKRLPSWQSELRSIFLLAAPAIATTCSSQASCSGGQAVFVLYALGERSAPVCNRVKAVSASRVVAGASSAAREGLLFQPRSGGPTLARRSPGPSAACMALVCALSGSVQQRLCDDSQTGAP